MATESTPIVRTVWSDRNHGVEVRFVGKATYRRAAPLPTLLPDAPEALAFLQQVHSNTVIETVTAGDAGPGDGLVSAKTQLALTIVTADCVPILLAGPVRIAAVHAGWRGLVQGIVPATLARMVGNGPLVAWVGPCIGPCCYEVDEDVALALAGASSFQAIQRDRGPKPHVDLRIAAESQLREGGVQEIRHLGPCTRCCEELWSYRRDGALAGRNHGFIWRPR